MWLFSRIEAFFDISMWQNMYDFVTIRGVIYVCARKQSVYNAIHFGVAEHLSFHHAGVFCHVQRQVMDNVFQIALACFHHAVHHAF